MFSGIIQAVGRLAARQMHGDGAQLLIAADTLDLSDVVPGDSIAVAGVCLTVTAHTGTHWHAEASAETLRLTTLGSLRTGDAVNLEKALRLSDRLGGHLVSGHVDGIGAVARIDHEPGGAQRWQFRAPAALMRYIAAKGSICVDGVSLTVNAVDDEGFGVTLIPHTLAHTSFSERGMGDAVNLEVDLIARYLERLHPGAAA